MARRRLLLVSVGLLVLAACDGRAQSDAGPSPAVHSTGTTQEPDPAGTRLDCSSFVYTEQPPDDYRVLRAAVGLPAWPDSGILQAIRDGTPGRPRLYAKAGVVIRARVPSTITIKAPLHGVAIGWGDGPIRPARRVEVPPCPGHGTPWLSFPGGFWVDRRTCVTLAVQVGGHVDPVRIAVGALCGCRTQPRLTAPRRDVRRNSIENEGSRQVWAGADVGRSALAAPFDLSSPRTGVARAISREAGAPAFPP